MKKFIAVLLLLAPSFAFAQFSQRYLSETQALTRAAPAAADALDPTKSISLEWAQGFRISVCAPAGQTLTSGTLQAWLFDLKTNQWMRNPQLDLTVNSGTLCQVFPDQRVTARSNGWFMYAANAVVVSSGTTVSVNYTVFVNTRQ